MPMQQREGVSVEERATLHESSVKGAQELVGSFARPRAQERRPRSSRARLEVRVHPLVMARALQLQAARPGTRLRIVDASTVLVE
jgi:hypothetical protein